MAKNELPQTRELVLYKNYDLYDVGQKMPPISFYQNMNKFKSVADYLKQIKRNKKKKNKSKKMKRRKRAFLVIASIDSNHIDFPLDSQMTPLLEPSESLQGANLIGVTDPYTPAADFSGNNVGSNLNYGQQVDFPPDLIEETSEDVDFDDPDRHEEVANIPVAGNLPYGLKDGIVDRDVGTYTDSQRYGNTNSGNTVYNANFF